MHSCSHPPVRVFLGRFRKQRFYLRRRKRRESSLKNKKKREENVAVWSWPDCATGKNKTDRVAGRNFISEITSWNCRKYFQRVPVRNVSSGCTRGVGRCERWERKHGWGRRDSTEGRGNTVRGQRRRVEDRILRFQCITCQDKTLGHQNRGCFIATTVGFESQIRNFSIAGEQRSNSLGLFVKTL